MKTQTLLSVITVLIFCNVSVLVIDVLSLEDALMRVLLRMMTP